MNINEINEFINSNLKSIDTKYRQKYHFMGQIGWINDPNGFIYIDGYYHLFYQYAPKCLTDSALPMCWGHAKSKDLFIWEYLPVAIAPSEPYDKDGCWSGSSIYVDGTLYLFYAGHYVEGDIQRETVNMAISKDGVHFTKYEKNPVIIPEEKHTSTRDFRDPYIFRKDGKYYIVIGTNKDNKPCIALYTSGNLYDGEFVSYFYKNDQMGTNLECPAFTENKYFICSPQNVPIQEYDHYNVSSSIFIKGDFENEIFKPEFCCEIDHGLEFYAPQSTEGKDGKTVMMTWFQMWGRKYINQMNGNKWEGCMTLPRILEYKNNHLYQSVPQDIEKYMSEPQDISIKDKVLIPEASYLKIEGIKEDLSIYFGEEDNYFEIRYDSQKDVLNISREHAKIPLGGVDNSPSTQGIRRVPCHSSGSLKLEIYFDRISNEIFINDGVEAMSSLFYLENTKKYIWSNKPVKGLIKEIKL